LQTSSHRFCSEILELDNVDGDLPLTIAHVDVRRSSSHLAI
jgi:hypothetical protein